MNELYSSIENLRSEYREIFKKSHAEIANRIDELRPDGLDADVTDKFPVNSDGALWQTKVLDMLENDISKEVYRKYKEILAYRSQFKCVGCATCCNLACSEFSPVELKQKAENGDNFAAQFLSVFVPYASKEDARKVYPEYIKMLEENKEDNVYFYHCALQMDIRKAMFQQLVLLRLIQKIHSNGEVVPLVGTWIEIDTKYATNCGSGSCPSWARGLKSGSPFFHA